MEMWSHPEQVMHWLLVLTFVSVIPATCRTIGHAAGFSIAQSLWWAHFIKFHRLLSALLFTLTVIFELGCVAASIIAVPEALAGINITDSTVLMVSHLLNLASYIYVPYIISRVMNRLPHNTSSTPKTCKRVEATNQK